MQSLLKKMGMHQTRHVLKSLKSSTAKKESLAGYQEKQIFDKNAYARSSTKTSQFYIPSLKTIQNVSEQIIPSDLLKSKKNSQRQKEKKQIPAKSSIVKKPNKIQTKNKFYPKNQKQISQVNQIQNKKPIQHDQQFGQTQKLQEIVAYLRYKLSSKCLLPNHEHNKITFICFDSQCKNRLGCSYCFLSTHQYHTKCQIKACIEDLQETIFKVKANQQLLSKKVSTFCEEFYSKINSQIQKIRQQFEINIAFFREQLFFNKSKLIDDFDNNIRQKYESYLKKVQAQITELKDQSNFDAKSKLNQDDGKILQNFPNINKMKFKHEKKQQEILQNFDDFKLDKIYLYLRNRLETFHLQASEIKSIFQFLDKINYQIAQVFQVYKKAIPKIKLKKLVIEKPNILGCSKFNLD